MAKDMPGDYTVKLFYQGTQIREANFKVGSTEISLTTALLQKQARRSKGRDPREGDRNRQNGI
ncbi:MAG: hypothetical protein IPK58_24120 [Acidobacteria bacterium]|nr:hypothetical protein [Acidobacteriota bacterium]